MRSLLKAVPLFLILILPGLAAAQKSSVTKAKKVPQVKNLATIDGVPITETQARMEGAAAFDSLEIQVMKAKAAAARNEHDILEKSVEKIIEDKLLRAEAETLGISKEELLKREVQQKITEPAASEVDAFYEKNKDRIGRPKEEITPSIIKYLKREKENELTEALLEKLEKEHRVVRLLEPLRYDVTAAGRPSRGPVNAPVLLVLFSDFQCPYCKQFNETIKEVLKNYGDKVRLVFRQFPLTEIHPNAQKAAEASLCAEAQGHFWEMHDLMFQNQGNLQLPVLKERAGKIGLDVAAFDNCLDSSRTGGVVKEDLRAGAASGVEGTPALFINGRFIYGARPYEDVAQIIDEELKSKK